MEDGPPGDLELAYNSFGNLEFWRTAPPETSIVEDGTPLQSVSCCRVLAQPGLLEALRRTWGIGFAGDHHVLHDTPVHTFRHSEDTF